MKVENYINDIVMVIDASSSMEHLKDEVVKIVDNLVQHLANRSQELQQDTRISVYFFSSNVECAIWSRDSLRLPSIKGLYVPNGMTSLIDGTLQAISDLEKIPELYGDFSRLIYVISDGAENHSRHSYKDLQNKLKSLPDNYTLAFLAPDAQAVSEAKRAGFLADNISIWDVTSKKGLQEAGNKIKASVDNFMQARSTGARKVNNLFKVDVNFSNKEVKSALAELKTDEYIQLEIRKKVAIQDFVESWKIPFRKGANYYQLTKKETVQSHKQVLVQDKINGKVYSGLNARKLLGLPNNEVKVEPGNFDKYDIFVQSTSNNRNLMPGTKLIVLK